MDGLELFESMSLEAIDTKVLYAPDHTGLIWQLGEVPKLSWDEALEYAANLRLGGFNDWRLPTDKELEALIDRTQYGPVMRADSPWLDSSYYWSSTTDESYTEYAWVVNYSNGYVYSGSMTYDRYVRCVRGEIK
jgi:hypothetical protein